MSIISKLLKTTLITILLISTLWIPPKAHAVEDSILGVSLQKFNDVISARGALEVTKDEYSETTMNPGFLAKLKVDTLRYRLEILKIANELGSNYTELIPEHIKVYNGLLIRGHTDVYQIDAEIKDDGTYTISSTVQETIDEINKLIGSSGDKGDIESLDATIWSQLNSLSNANESFADNNGKLKEYYTEYISTIRYLMTSIKDIYTHFPSEMTLGEELKSKFIKVYDAIASFALENDLYALQNLNLFGDTIGFDITAEGEDLLEYVASWNPMDGKQFDEWASGNKVDNSIPMNVFGSYSEYMLKNIAASSTFKPFQTNLNTTEPFAFLGDESKVFHETLGTKRKLLLTPKESDSTLNTGLNIAVLQNLKIMTLRDFVEKEKGNKIMYADNLQYTLTDLDKVQDVIKGDKQKANEDSKDNTELDDIAETTQEEKGNTEKGFVKRLWDWAVTGLGNSFKYSYDGNVTSLWKMVNSAESLFSDGKSVSTLVFASGDIDNLMFIDKNVSDNADILTMSNLIYRNIIEEYWTYGTKLKMTQDMDKPLFVDIYGNIVSASGIVLIPAMSNPYYQVGTEPTFLFTRSFIESYPKFTVGKGNLKVSNKDKDKLAFYATPMTDEEIDEDIKKNEWDYKGELVEVTKEDKDKDKEKAPQSQTKEDGKVKDDGELSNATVGAFVEQEIDYIPGVNFYVGKAVDGELGKYLYPTKNLSPIAYKFDNEYEPVKSLDLFSFGKLKTSPTIDSYYSLRDSLGEVSGPNRALMINEYTVNLSFDEGDAKTVTFKDFPDSKEIKRYMYLTNLERISEVKDGSLTAKDNLSGNLKIVTTEALFKGISDTSELNSLVPKVVEDIFDTWGKFNIDKANDRYKNSLGGSIDNNIIYVKNVEEIDSLKNILPVIYKFILVITILAIILNIIMYVISSEGRFARIGKLLIVLYILTFLFIVMPKASTVVINSPMKSIFQEELMHWTVIEQEKMSNTTLIERDGKIDLSEDTFGSSLKLYEVKYSSPFSIFQKDDYMDIDEFYSQYVNNDALFKSQTTPMYMDGKFLTIDTNSIFKSSSVLVEDQKDPLMKMRHDVYGNPEFAYYLPYYMIVDNLVYNINNLTDVTKKVPKDVFYSNGDTKTSGRVDGWINSSLFLNYEDFLERVASYEAGDKISKELAVAEIDDMLIKYGDPNDFLGLGKILGQPKTISLTDPNENKKKDEKTDSKIGVSTDYDKSDEALEPFSKEGLSKIQKAGWYPNNFDTNRNPNYKQLFSEKIEKVNAKTKKFMLDLGDISSIVADEHLIKTIALYASIEFNKEFNSFATNKGPTGIELNNLPIERLMMSLTLPREQLIDNSITTYPNQLVNNTGYLGLTIGVINDFLLIFINNVKPVMVVLIWAFVGIVIYIKKILLPDPNNESILGSIKIFSLFLGLTFIYSSALAFVIKLVNWSDSSLVGIIGALVLNLSYTISLMYIMFVMFRDSWNLGSRLTLRSLDRGIDTVKRALGNALMSIPLMERIIPGYADRFNHDSNAFEKYADKLEIPKGQRGSGGGFAPKSAEKSRDLVPVNYDRVMNTMKAEKGHEPESYRTSSNDDYRRSDINDTASLIDNAINDLERRSKAQESVKQNTQNNIPDGWEPRDYPQTIINDDIQIPNMNDSSITTPSRQRDNSHDSTATPMNLESKIESYSNPRR